MNRNLSRLQFAAQYGATYPSVGVFARAGAKTGGQKSRTVTTAEQVRALRATTATPSPQRAN